jgi:NAD-dependent deacetylase
VDVEEKIEKLTQILKNSGNIVFFGGAGVSTASGIPDFRSSNGLWNENIGRNFSPEELVSHTMYMQYPEEFFEFYKSKLIYPDAKPNAAHYALAKLEEMGKLRAVVTQNIDGLHQAAGSKVVYELHGSVLRNYCESCHKRFDGTDIVLKSEGIPRCPDCGGRVKPDVVLYEESLDSRTMSDAISAISGADTLIIGGTSLIVYPAAGLIRYFHGSKLVLINKSRTGADDEADLCINDDIAMVLGRAVEGM